MIDCIRNAGIEADASDIPPLSSANGFDKSAYVVIGKVITEGTSSVVKKVLPIDKSYGAFCRRLN